MTYQEPLLSGLLDRIARALERLVPTVPAATDFDAAQAFVWQTEPDGFLPVAEINRVPLTLLKGIDRMRDTLLVNTLRFARGLLPTTRFYGVRAAWARAHWSRPSMQRWAGSNANWRRT